MGRLTTYWGLLGLTGNKSWPWEGRPPASRQVHKTKLQLDNLIAVLEPVVLPAYGSITCCFDIDDVEQSKLGIGMNVARDENQNQNDVSHRRLLWSLRLV